MNKKVNNVICAKNSKLKIIVMSVSVFLVLGCEEHPCTDGPVIPPAIAALGIAPSDAQTCSFGGATHDSRWPNLGYIKVAHDESIVDTAFRYVNRLDAMGWERAVCDGELGGVAEDDILECYLTRSHIVRLSIYEMNKTLVDIDLYGVAN